MSQQSNPMLHVLLDKRLGLCVKLLIYISGIFVLLNLRFVSEVLERSSAEAKMEGGVPAIEQYGLTKIMIFDHIIHSCLSKNRSWSNACLCV